MISAEEFKPEMRGESDFFSWNLYRWLRKYPKKYGVFLSQANGGKYIGIIQDNGWLTGFALRRLCSGSGAGRFPEVGVHLASFGMIDITEEFYAEYRRIGVCAIHGDNAHDWEATDSGDYRICKHCEKVEVKKTQMLEKVTWEDAE